MKLNRFLCTLLVAGAGQIASAQSEPTPEPGPNLTRQTMERITLNPNAFTEEAIRQLFHYSPDGELTRDAIAVHEAMQTARQRASALGRVFAFDLDGDMEVSTAEVERQLPYLNQGQSVALQTLLATADRNRDGSLSLTELWQDAMSREARMRPDRKRMEELLQFDANQDGKVTPDEIAQTVEKIAANEVSPNVTPPQSLRQPVAGQSCEFPEPSAEAEILLLGGYEGYAVSNMAMSGLDRETSAAVIHIEEGDAPLYILATAFDSIVWKITGDTDRVERFVAPATARGVGVAGLAPEVVHFEPGRNCLPKYFKDRDSGEAIAAKGRVSSKLKRSVDHMFGAYTLGEIHLPSGAHKGITGGGTKANGLTIIKNNRRYLVTDDGVQVLDPPKDQQVGDLERKLQKLLLRYYRGGILEFAEGEVVASHQAQPYDVLPQQAGLLQLARQGALSQTPDGYFKIDKPIPRFPAGLNGGHSVRFILSTGVPMPGGSPGHSTVIREEDGTCVAGHRCP